MTGSSDSFLSQSSFSALSDENLEYVCCGIPLSGTRSLVEHYEEFHSCFWGTSRQFAEVTILNESDFPPRTVSYQSLMLEQAFQEDSLPEISLAECCSQMVENFVKSRNKEKQLLQSPRVDPTSKKAIESSLLYAPNAENPLHSLTHCTDLKSIDVIPNRKCFTFLRHNNLKGRSSGKSSVS